MNRLKLKIMDVETNGCAVKFGLGDYYAKDYLTIYFKFDAMLYPLVEDHRFCLEPFFDGKLPFLLLVPPRYGIYFDDERHILIKEAKKPNSPIISVYYGDTMADVLDKLYQAKAIAYVDNGDVLNS